MGLARRAELSAYVAVVAWATATFLYKGVQYSNQFRTGGAWAGYAPNLKPSWFGQEVDLSDIQWRQFRSNLPLLMGTMLALAGWNRWAFPKRTSLDAKLKKSLAFTALFLAFLHGSCVVYLVGLLSLFHVFVLAVAGRPWGALALWAAMLASLLLVRLTEGFQPSLVGVSHWLLRQRGSLRWDVCFNLTALRMLSYGLDVHWTRQGRTSEAKDAAEPIAPSLHRPTPPAAHPSLLALLTYALYPPLYVAGPIMTFGDFMAQRSQAKESPGAAAAESHRRRTMRYALRFLANWACVELLTHCLFFNSLAAYKVGSTFAAYGLEWGATEVGLTGFWALAFVWAKFATIWRLTRLCALLDGVSPPENMVKCFANNYDAEGFWKNWHASFNRWLVRYLYVPLGGSRTKVFSIWLVFGFVALWHDLEWRLLAWAWLACLALLPEILIKAAARSRAAAPARAQPWWRHVCAAGAALNISALMLANLAGFVVGLDGVSQLLGQLLAEPLFVATAFGVFFCAAHVMFAIEEARECGGERRKRGGTFCYLFSVTGVQAGPLFKGLAVPLIPDGTIQFAVGAVGAIIMLNNLYLHSSPVHTRCERASHLSPRRASNFVGAETAIALFISLVIDVIIIAVFAATVFGAVEAGAVGFGNAGAYLQAVYGKHVKIISAIGLLAAGNAATVTSTYAAQTALDGYLGVKASRRWRTGGVRLLTLGLTLAIAFALQESSLDTLSNWLSIIQSLVLPFVVTPLLYLTSCKHIMGDEADKWRYAVIMGGFTVFLIGMNAYMFVSMSSTAIPMVAWAQFLYWLAMFIYAAFVLYLAIGVNRCDRWAAVLARKVTNDRWPKQGPAAQCCGSPECAGIPPPKVEEKDVAEAQKVW